MMVIDYNSGDGGLRVFGPFEEASDAERFVDEHIPPHKVYVMYGLKEPSPPSITPAASEEAIAFVVERICCDDEYPDVPDPLFHGPFYSFDEAMEYGFRNLRPERFNVFALRSPKTMKPYL